MNCKRQVKRKLGHVVQIPVCRKMLTWRLVCWILRRQRRFLHANSQFPVSSSLPEPPPPLPLVKARSLPWVLRIFKRDKKQSKSTPTYIYERTSTPVLETLNLGFVKIPDSVRKKITLTFYPRSPPNWKTVILPPIFRISWEFKPRENFIICVDLQASSALADQVFTVTTFTRDRIQGKGWLFNKIYVQITLNVHQKINGNRIKSIIMILTLGELLWF